MFQSKISQYTLSLHHIVNNKINFGILGLEWPSSRFNPSGYKHELRDTIDTTNFQKHINFYPESMHAKPQYYCKEHGVEWPSSRVN